MLVEQKMAMLDVVYFHILELNLHYYQEIFGKLTLENFTKSIVETQKELTLMIQNKQIDDYYERIIKDAV